MSYEISSNIKGRFGVITVTDDLFFSSAMPFLMADLLPTKVEYNYYRAGFVINAYSELFDVLLEGESAPEYTLEVVSGEDGKPISITPVRV
jgi:hypothetical protein